MMSGLECLSSYSAGLPTPPDVYFSAAYGSAEMAAGAGEWQVISSCDGRVQLPWHKRDSGGVVDAVSPYGYAGLFVDPAVSHGQFVDTWQAVQTLLREEGAISLFLRQSPLVPCPWISQIARPLVSDHGTILLDTVDEDLAWAAMEGRSRTSVRKAQRQGMSGHVREALAEDVVEGGPFRELYDAAMARVGASSRYLFADDYYHSLVSGLGSDLLIGEVADADGAVVSAALFMRHEEWLHYHLSGSRPQAGRLGATNLLIWEAIRFSVNAGISSLHLGGGVGDGDHLYRFKRSFGGQRLAFSTWGVVLDSDRYESATEDQARHLNTTTQTLEQSGYFPAFRAVVE